MEAPAFPLHGDMTGPQLRFHSGDIDDGFDTHFRRRLMAGVWPGSAQSAAR